jgi:hypothetical protein
MQGVTNVPWNKLSEKEYLTPTLKKNSFLNTNLTDRMRVNKLRDYFKFVMVCNPLERLVSAYRNKIEPPLKYCDHDRKTDPLVNSLSDVRYMDLFQAHRRLLLTKYQTDALIQWAEANGSYDLSVDFSSYVRWIIDSVDSELNEHFSSILVNVAPCRIRYHLYLNFKNYSREVGLLIQRLNTSSDYFVGHSYHRTPETETCSTLPCYYSQLSGETKRQLLAHMARELDFYYHLYPEDQLRHLELLGVDQRIYNATCDAGW